jgi:GT2 family glycosyltransferase
MAGREELLKKLLSTVSDEYEKVIVDDPSLLLAAKRNKGTTWASGEYFLFVDDDNYLEPGAIEAALDLASQIGVGVVGFMACYDDKPHLIADGGSMRNYLTGFTTGLNTNGFWLRALRGGPYEVDEIANAFMMHSELFYELQGFDEKNFPIDLDEADFCKRVKNKGLKVMMCPAARCYHKSQTYSHIPDFRRPLNAYFHGRNRIIYQRKFNNALRYGVYLCFYMPVFVGFYSLSLLWRRKPLMIFHFLKGVFDGIFCRRKNKYQSR